MKSNYLQIFGLLILGILLVSPGPADAWTVPEGKCRADISKALAKYSSTQFKNIAKCHGLRNRWQLPEAWDCNDPEVADRHGKGERAAAKLRMVVAGAKSRCRDKVSDQPFDAVLANFTRCPSPAAGVDDGGATTGIDDFDELAECLVTLGDRLVEQLGNRILGTPLWTARPGARRCHKVIAKMTRKYMVTTHNVRNRAQSKDDRAGIPVAYGQNGVDVRSKINKARSKLAGTIYKKCGAYPLEDLNPVQSCADAAEGLADCVVDTAGRTARGMAALGFELPERCPARAVLTARAAKGDEVTATRLDVGFTGLAHGMDIMDGIVSGVRLDCDADCANCAVTEDPLRDRPSGFCRCEADPTSRCDVINGPDADDCGGGMCRCMFGPPLAIAAGGIPICVVNELQGDLTGIADAGTGESAVTVNLLSKVHLGIAWLQPCPTCEGDGVVNDGISGGVCNGGVRDGLSCDANASDRTFGDVSYECLPESSSGVTGSGLVLSMTMTSDVSSLPFGTTCDAPADSMQCACAVCSGDTTLACNDDQVCKDLDVGDCVSSGGGAVRVPNKCGDGVCVDVGNGNGECGAAGPVEYYCDNMLRANGRGLLSCQTDEDCAAYASQCGDGGCGLCTIAEPRSCFLDPITATGHATPDGADMVTTFCVSPTASAAVNVVAGLPGAARFKVNFDFEGLCPNGAPFDKPGGSNCM